MDNERYYAITRKGQFIMADSLDAVKSQISNPDDVEMYVYSYKNTATIPYESMSGNKYYWPQYQIVDERGNVTTYQRGNYIVKHIYPDTGTYMFDGRRVTFTKIDTRESITAFIAADPNWRVDDIQQFYYTLIDKIDELTEKDKQQKIEEQNKHE